MILPVQIAPDLPEVDVRIVTDSRDRPIVLIGRKGSFGRGTMEGQWSRLEDCGAFAGFQVSFVIPEKP